ncbi:MAG TPA: PRTRC system protein C [Burkholderiaceae bacterium]|nr:PRTRC system protein C [Burkholderiaceae bacterium]
MTLQVTPIKREFTYAGMTLADPSPTMTPEQVKAFYAAHFTELTNAEIEEQPNEGDGTVVRYAFSRVVGTKG